MKDVTTRATYPIQFVIEEQNDWDSSDEEREQIALVAFIGTERHELAVVKMSGYSAKNNPETAARRLLEEILK
jgi:hypothetical protein